MKNNIYKLFAAILVCLLSAAGVSANTPSETVAKGKLDNGILWELTEDGVLTISGKGAIPDYNKAGGESPNVNDRPWMKYRKSVKALKVEKGVTGIGARAFQNFSQLRSAVIDPGVKVIGAWAFQNCGNLADVTVSGSTRLKTGAFRSAPCLAAVKASENTAYTKSPYYLDLCEVILTGDFRKDMMRIARSQMGYHEGENEDDFDGLNTSSKGDYTEFGRFMDSSGNQWCSEFASWCVCMSGLSLDVFSPSRSARAETFTGGNPSKYYTWSDLIYAGGSYEPKAGDIMLWNWDPDASFSPTVDASHTGIFDFAEVENGTVTMHAIDGNSGNQVRERTYVLTLDEGLLPDNKGRLCYIVSPAYDDSSIQKHTVTFDCSGGSVSTTAKTVATGGLYGPMPIPKKRGAKFQGWYTEPDGGTVVNMYTPVSSTSDHTLYARWK